MRDNGPHQTLLIMGPWQHGPEGHIAGEVDFGIGAALRSGRCSTYVWHVMLITETTGEISRLIFLPSNVPGSPGGSVRTQQQRPHLPLLHPLPLALRTRVPRLQEWVPGCVLVRSLRLHRVVLPGVLCCPCSRVCVDEARGIKSPTSAQGKYRSSVPRNSDGRLVRIKYLAVSREASLLPVRYFVMGGGAGHRTSARGVAQVFA